MAMFSLGREPGTCTDRPHIELTLPQSIKNRPQQQNGTGGYGADNTDPMSKLSAGKAGEQRLPATSPQSDVSHVYKKVLSQVQSVNGSAVRSPLLHRRYKNFDGISGKDDSRIKDVDSMEQFKRAILTAHDSLVCVTFSAKWCGPWRMIKPDVHRLSHIHGDVIFYEVDVDDNEEIAAARRVVCMPTFQFFKCGYMLDKFAEPNRIKLDETIRKLRRMEVKEDDCYRFEQFPPKYISSRRV